MSPYLWYLLVFPLLAPTPLPLLACYWQILAVACSGKEHLLLALRCTKTDCYFIIERGQSAGGMRRNRTKYGGHAAQKKWQ